MITTITHRHADRVSSYRLLAEEWSRRRHRAEEPAGHLS
jgi:hypothetical protein